MRIKAIKKSLGIIRLKLVKNLYRLFFKTELPISDTHLNTLIHILRKCQYKIGLFSKPKNSNRVIVYMSDEYGLAGLADRLRTIRTAYVCAAINNKSFYLYHHVKDCVLQEYLIPNEINWSIKKQEIDFCLKNIALCYNYRELPKCKYNRELHMYNADGIISEMKNAGVYLQYTDHIVHQQLFRPSEYLQTLIDNAMHTTGVRENEYIAFHLRFLNFFEQVEITGKVTATPQEQQMMIDTVHSVIEKVCHETGCRNVLIFSDSNSFLNATHPDYIKHLPGTVGHISKHANKQITDKTFVDLYVMSKAKAIYSIRGENIYGGGFSREAAIIGNKPFIEVPLIEGSRQGFIGTYGGQD